MGAIAWQSDVDAAFAQARAERRALLLYWGAGWCPPCNRLKATIFGHAPFAAVAESLVTLHIDGDADGAQQLGERFGLRSYPTLVLFRPDTSELTRLPCEIDGARFTDLVRLAQDARHTAAESLAAAQDGTRALDADEWRLLAWYSWDTDEGRLLRGQDLAATLTTLAQACEVPDAVDRLAFHAVHATVQARKGSALATPVPASAEASLVADVNAAQARLPQWCATLERVLASAPEAQMDLITNMAFDIVRALPDLAPAWRGALEWLESSPDLSTGDQLAALRARLRLNRIGTPIAGLSTLARARVALALDQAPDLAGRQPLSSPGNPPGSSPGNQPPSSALNLPLDPASKVAMRHSVVNTAAGLLSDLGLLDEAQAVLTAELPRSHAPYYFMHNLAAIAKKRGDHAQMLSWYEQAWQLARGPATRLQWGVTYLAAMIDFTPQERPRIDALADALRAEFAASPDARYQRNRTQLERLHAKLAALD